MKKHKIQQNILTRLLKKAAKYREMDNKILADVQMFSRRLIEQGSERPSITSLAVRKSGREIA